MQSRVAIELGEWAATTTWEQIPDRIQRFTRLVWMDTIGCLILGSDHDETRSLATMLQQRDGSGPATTVTGLSLSPQNAALVNGVASGIDLLDSGNVASGGHVAGYVLPAVLAEAGVAGRDFGSALTAFVIGYEVAARIGAAQRLRPAMHPSGTWNVIGAAVAVQSLRGADRELMAKSIELAANLTITTSWDATVHGATVRNLYQAMPGYLGTLAADLASIGFQGGPSSVEVTFGELSSTQPFNAEACTSGLGETWLLDETYLKLYPTCRSFHGVLDAVAEAVEEVGRGEYRDCEVLIGVEPFAFQQNRAVHSANSLAARESLPVSAALALVDGELTPEAFRVGTYGKAAVLDLAARLQISELPRRTERSRPGSIEIRRQGAQVVRRDVDVPLGNPSRAIDDDVIIAKFVQNTRRMLGDAAEPAVHALLEGPLDERVLDAVAAQHWLPV